MKIYVHKNSQQYGPYTVEEVKNWLAAGQLLPNDLAIFDGGANWGPLSSIPGVVAATAIAPPPWGNAAPVAPPPPPAFVPVKCVPCGGDGSRLALNVQICPQCRWLRPLAPGYSIDVKAFQWAQDGTAMATLRSLTPLNSAARAVSDSVGRKWVETTLNGILLGENQLPNIYVQAVRAARLLGMTHMPDVYISGEKMWDVTTYGSDKSAFIVVGTALINNFQGDDLLFLLAREIGHCRAGHALWKTLIRFLIGEQGPRKGMMAGGILNVLNPSNLIEGALELPLLAWARQSEVTADRAGMLAVGNEEVARRVLFAWSLKSIPLYRQINIPAWLQQQVDSDDDASKLSEMFSSSTPYITRRLKNLSTYVASPELRHWRGVIERASQMDQASSFAPASLPEPPRPVAPPPVDVVSRPVAPPPPETKPPDDDMRLVCSSCKGGLRVPRSVLAGKDVVNIRCPNADCGKVMTLRRSPSANPAPPPLDLNSMAAP
jgi:Zn-dependent protease with chaperone function